MSAGSESTRVIILALFANLGIALAKFIAAFFSGSASMLAEAVHSLVDTTNQGLLLVGGRLSKKPATESHPLGYGREAFFWSFIVAILLFSLGGLFAIYEGAHKLSSSEVVGSPLIGLIVLSVSLALEGFSFYACVQEVNAQRQQQSFREWFKKTTSSELLVVLTEDTAAIIGLLVATSCLLLTWLTGNPLWDAMGSILVGIILVIVAFFLAVEIKSLLVGEASHINFKPFLEDHISRLFPDGKLLRVIAVQGGSKDILLSIKFHPGSVQDVSLLIDKINALEKATKAAYPDVRWQFVEPDNAD